MKREVELLSYIYPGTLKVRIQDRLHTFITSEYWARKAVVAIRFGGGWKGINILKTKGREIDRNGKAKQEVDGNGSGDGSVCTQDVRSDKNRINTR